MLSMLIALLLLSLSFVGSSSEPEVGAELSYIEGNGAVTKVPIGSRKATPDLSGTLIDGSEYRMERGKPIVLNVWASWCSPCRAEAPALQELSVKHPEVQFLGVLTRDSVVSARAFVKRFGIEYPSLVDDAILLKFHGQLTPNAIPTTLIIDTEGRVAARVSGEVTYSALEDLIERVKSNE